jgi:hypothetical protein
VAVQRDYYGIDVAGRETLDSLNSYIEGKAAPSLKKLISNPKTITEYDWVVLSFLFANFAVRNPASIEEWRAAFLDAAKKVNAMKGKMCGRRREALVLIGDQSKLRPELYNEAPTVTHKELMEHASILKVKGGHRVAADDISGALKDIAECIQQMAFWILGTPNDLFFVTSDRPLTLQRRKTGSRVGAGWKNPDALGSIALCPSRFLLMFYGEQSGVFQTKASLAQVLGLNVEVIRFADKEVYSRSAYQEANDWMKSIGRWSTKR